MMALTGWRLRQLRTLIKLRDESNRDGSSCRVYICWEQGEKLSHEKELLYTFIKSPEHRLSDR